MRSFIPFLLIIFALACKEEKKIEARAAEVEFRLDSSYFDFTRIDSFHNYRLPHLKAWKTVSVMDSLSGNRQYVQSNDSLDLTIYYRLYSDRAVNSYKHYKDYYTVDSREHSLLDLSNYLKDELKLTQLILKNEKETIFKLIHDDPTGSYEVDIVIDNGSYSEDMILLTESIIGQLKFIKS